MNDIELRIFDVIYIEEYEMLQVCPDCRLVTLGS